MKKMLIYKTQWNEMDSFRLIPVENNCNFLEAIYNPEDGVLAVISKNKIIKPLMLPRLKNNGNIQFSGGKPVEERKDVETYYEYYIEDKDDIEEFVELVSINYPHVVLEILKNEKENILGI
jgi:hypothetical protein